MTLLVTSASGLSGDGFGTLLAFALSGAPPDVFCDDDRIADPRGLVVRREEGVLYLNSGRNRILAIDSTGTVIRDTGPIEGLNPGGGNFGPDGRYYVGLRGARTVSAFPHTLDAPGEPFLASGIVPFPRGFAFGHDGTFFLSSGIGRSGEGDNTIIAFAPDKSTPPYRLVRDPELSPLDLAIAPNGNICVSSEYPFGAAGAVTTVREYDRTEGHVVRVFHPRGLAEFHKPRGLRFGPDGNLYCVARDEVVVFDFVTSKCLGAIVRMPRLYGQALEFFP